MECCRSLCYRTTKETKESCAADFEDTKMSIASTAKEFYESELRHQLEKSSHGHFVAIDADSKEYFVSESFLGAALAAKAAHPSEKPFVIRIGHDAAFHIGSATR